MMNRAILFLVVGGFLVAEVGAGFDVAVVRILGILMILASMELVLLFKA